MVLPLFLSALGGGLAKAGVLGAAGSFLANPMIASAIGSGIGTLIETGDPGKALLGGAGAYAGGQLLGGATGAAPGVATNSVSGPMSESLRPMARPPGIGGVPAPTPAPSIFDASKDFAMSNAGMGAGIGGMLGAGLADGLNFSGGSAPNTPAPPRTVPPMVRTPNTPPPGYVPGRSPEFNYGISAPYTRDYANQYAVTGMNRGGMVQRAVPGYGPVRMQAGGIAELGADRPKAPTPNEKEIVAAAVAAVRGQHPQPEIALGAFLAKFGEAALRDLVDRVRSGPVGATSPAGKGKVEGPGDGMSDMIPANIDGEQDVLLSDGEYVVPADVVSGLGNGSSDAGAKALDTMAERVRMARTGKAKQAPEVPTDRMLAA
jgi:hypothetical protein